MIELPDFAVPGSVRPTFIDAGFTQRGLGSIGRIDRKGSRYRVAYTYGPYEGEQARQMLSRLIAGKSEGIRVPLPMLHDQGSPGSFVMDGAAQLGKTINLRGGTPGYFCKSGFWLSIVDADGRHYLHNVKTGGRADGSGNLTITLNELPRASFSDGAAVHLAKPMVQGIVDGNELEWELSVDRVVPFSFAIEEER